MELWVLAVIAGVFFGLWPLLMNLSGLTGNVASVAFTTMVLTVLLPLAIRSGFASLATANWTMVLLAGVTGAAGLLAFNSMLAQATRVNLGTLFVLMIVVQATIPALYHIAMNGFSANKVAGLVLAIIAGVLLTK